MAGRASLRATFCPSTHPLASQATMWLLLASSMERGHALLHEICSLKRGKQLWSLG